MRLMVIVAIALSPAIARPQDPLAELKSTTADHFATRPANGRMMLKSVGVYTVDGKETRTETATVTYAARGATHFCDSFLSQKYPPNADGYPVPEQRNVVQYLSSPNRWLQSARYESDGPKKILTQVAAYTHLDAERSVGYCQGNSQIPFVLQRFMPSTRNLNQLVQALEPANVTATTASSLQARVIQPIGVFEIEARRENGRMMLTAAQFTSTADDLEVDSPGAPKYRDRKFVWSPQYPINGGIEKQVIRLEITPGDPFRKLVYREQTTADQRTWTEYTTIDLLEYKPLTSEADVAALAIPIPSGTPVQIMPAKPGDRGIPAALSGIVYHNGDLVRKVDGQALEPADLHPPTGGVKSWHIALAVIVLAIIVGGWWLRRGRSA